VSDYQLVIIGGGLSGLAAGIRFARFGGKVLILEQHHTPGGLNSYYRRQGFLLETGLHAMTNYAPPKEKHAPLNRLFRQLKLSRKKFITHQQQRSEIIFPDQAHLFFSNDISLLSEEVSRVFPTEADNFQHLVKIIKEYDPFIPRDFISTRKELKKIFNDPLLIDMLLCPLMIYGNSMEHDMDFDQFVIMFRAIFLEGFFRPQATIKEFLDYLLQHYLSFGGEIRFKTKVSKLDLTADKVRAVYLESGEKISCGQLISTIGWPNTLRLQGKTTQKEEKKFHGQMSFTELITILPANRQKPKFQDRTIIFYNFGSYDYCRPAQAVDPSWGVICFPDNFSGLESKKYFQIRVTNPANYDIWQQVRGKQYYDLKEEWKEKSVEMVAKIIGNYRQNIVYEDSFTPLTIEKFTAKAAGAVYGSPLKIKDGRTLYENFFIAGTDQGYLGIVGSMLSGVTMVNVHILR
jgi:phytoene dehydrogenase-like protein